MRISDWSSDVCSSDLPAWASPPCFQGMACTGAPGRNFWKPSTTSWSPALSPSYMTKPSLTRGPTDTGMNAADRKSVVKGKSVSVRVDLGGGRIIKKKTKENEYHMQDKLTNQNQ